MADSQIYNVIEACRSTLASAFAAEKSRLSLSIAATPASGDFKTIAPDYDRMRHTTFPAVFVLPFPDGQASPVSYYTTQQRASWAVPVAIEAVFREKKGTEADGVKGMFEYAQIIDACLVNNIRLGRSDTIVETPESIHPLYFRDGQGGALWGCQIRVTLRIDIEYS